MAARVGPHGGHGGQGLPGQLPARVGHQGARPRQDGEGARQGLGGRGDGGRSNKVSNQKLSARQGWGWAGTGGLVRRSGRGGTVCSALLGELLTRKGVPRDAVCAGTHPSRIWIHSAARRRCQSSRREGTLPAVGRTALSTTLVITAQHHAPKLALWAPTSHGRRCTAGARQEHPFAGSCSCLAFPHSDGYRTEVACPVSPQPSQDPFSPTMRPAL